jgi:hypothetical protein
VLFFIATLIANSSILVLFLDPLRPIDANIFLKLGSVI